MASEQYIRSLPPERQPVARVWAGMEPEEFQARLGLGIDDLRDELRTMRSSQPKPLRERLYDYGLAGAVIAYVIFDRGAIPPLMGGGK